MSKSNERWLTLDVLKAIFLVLMIIGHNMVWWFFEQDAYLAQPSFFVTRWVIPYIQINSYLMLMFPIVAGVALAYQN